MHIKMKGGGYREENGIVLADGFYMPYHFVGVTHQLKGANGVSGMFDWTGEGAKFVNDIKAGKYDIEEPFMPFWDEGHVDGEPPTERQSKLFNQWCRTKNKNYYDGENSLELLFKIALPRLKKDCGRIEDPWIVYVGIDKWLEWHPKENPAESLFEEIWFTLRHFYEPKGWQRLVWQWRTSLTKRTQCSQCIEALGKMTGGTE